MTDTMRSTKRKKTVYTRGSWTVKFVRLGEGYSGDYDPSDPEDEELYRIDLYYKRAPVEDDGSFCTCIPVTVSAEELAAIGARALTYLNQRKGIGTRGFRERLSYLPGSIYR